MLAAKRSFGNLRAATRSIHPAVPSRTLVSAVLLSSDRARFERKTVRQLQEELGERGLSTKGKKNILVERLFESVTRANIASSSFSTSSTSQAAKPRDAATVTAADSSASSTVIATETAIHSPSPIASEIPTAGEAPEHIDAIVASPGRIIDKETVEQMEEAAEQAPGGLIDMPTMVSLPEFEQQDQLAELMIPMSPDKYQNPPDHDPFTQPFTTHPSWLSLSGSNDSVTHQGQPNKPVDDPQSHTSEPQPEFQYLPDTTFLQEVAASIGIKLKSKVQSASDESQSLLRRLEADSGIRLPSFTKAVKETPSEEEHKFEFQDRQLNQQERNGAWTLAGILGLGFLLGGLGSKKETADDDDTKH